MSEQSNRNYSVDESVLAYFQKGADLIESSKKPQETEV